MSKKINQPLQANNAWSDWTPTTSGSGSMTVSITTNRASRYIVVGKMVYFYCSLTITTGGTASATVNLTYPVAAVDNGNSVLQGIGGYVDSGGGAVGAFGYIEPTTGVIGVRRYDAANWGLGTGRRVHISGFYEMP